MANPEHLDIFHQGADAWNSWRNENDTIDPDLSYANLAENEIENYNLGTVNLQRANLRGCKIKDSSLGGANLSSSDLSNSYLLDLRDQGINLSSSNLSNTYVRQCDFGFSQFERSDFTDAYFEGVVFSNSEMNRCILRNSVIRKCTFRGSRLRGVEFEKASLIRTILEDVNLGGSDMRSSEIVRGGSYYSDYLGVILGETVLSSYVFDHCYNLDKCAHYAPSIIDHATIKESKNLPEVFLRGTGLSSWEIELTRLYKHEITLSEIADVMDRTVELRTGKAIQFYSCFISYSSKEEAFAQKLYSDLQDQGINCWYAPENMQGGVKITNQILDGINVSDKLILVLSENSFTSDWVTYEIKETLKREKIEDRHMLFPISVVDQSLIKEWKLLDPETNANLAEEVRTYFIPDFSNWTNQESYKPAFERLLKDLRASD